MGAGISLQRSENLDAGFSAARCPGTTMSFLRTIILAASFRGHCRLHRQEDPIAVAGLQMQTPQAARRASTKDGASQSSLCSGPENLDAGFSAARCPE